MLLHKNKKIVYKTVLKTNSTWNFYISILLSIIGLLLCLSIPFAILDNPCEIFVERKFEISYRIAVIIEKYALLMDLLIIVLIFVMTYLSIKTIRDAIEKTNICISPWIEKGKYTLPHQIMKKRFKCTYEYSEEIAERYRQQRLLENKNKGNITWRLVYSFSLVLLTNYFYFNPSRVLTVSLTILVQSRPEPHGDLYAAVFSSTISKNEKNYKGIVKFYLEK